MLSKNQVIAITVTGLLVVLAGIMGWLFYFSPPAREGRAAGFNPPAYILVNSIEYRAHDNGRLSALDMTALRTLVNNKHPMIRARALTALFYIGGTDQAAAGSRIACEKVDDPHPLVRIYALSALDRMHSPEALKQATRLITDPDDSVRKKAAKIVAGASNRAQRRQSP